MIYRFEFMMSIVITPITLLVYYFTWTAIFGNGMMTSTLGYTLTDMISYFVVGMVINHAIYNNVGVDLQNKIMDGSLSADLLKPISPFFVFLIQNITNRAFAFIAEVLPVFFISLLMFKFQLPNMLTLLIFLISLMLSFLLNFMINIMMGLIAFWVKNIRSIQWFWFIIIRLFSGEFLPLEFFGATFITISSFLPFQYIRYSPIRIFIGKLDVYASLNVLFVQAIWIIILILVFQFFWKKAMKQFGAVGG